MGASLRLRFFDTAENMRLLDYNTESPPL